MPRSKPRLVDLLQLPACRLAEQRGVIKGLRMAERMIRHEFGGCPALCDRCAIRNRRRRLEAKAKGGRDGKG